MDVHLQLLKRRKTTGLTIKRIANSVLRCALSRSRLLCDAIGDILVQRGHVSKETYVEIVEEAIRTVNESASPDREAIRRESKAHYISGSWAIKTVHTCPNASYQLVEESAKDARRRPTPAHVHAADKYIRVLSGSVLANLPDRIVMLEALDSLHVPAGFAHALTPLSPDAKVSILFVPSLDLFAS